MAQQEPLDRDTILYLVEECPTLGYLFSNWVPSIERLLISMKKVLQGSFASDLEPHTLKVIASKKNQTMQFRKRLPYNIHDFYEFSKTWSQIP